MSGALVNNYSQLDSNILEVQLTLDATRVGFHQVSLTNYDSTSESQIAAGSVIECAGALYKFDSNESMTGSPSDGTVYIRIVPGLTTCTAEYTNTAPTWSDAYQGWYGTGGAATYRYLEFILYKSGSSYSHKYFYFRKQEKICNYFVSYGQSSSITVTANSETTLKYDSVIYDKWTDYNTSSGVFTCKLTGYYEIRPSLLVAPASTTSIRGFSNGLSIYKNSSEVAVARQGNVRAATSASGQRNISAEGIFVLSLAVTDTIEIKYTYGVLDTSNATVSENGTSIISGTNLIIKYLGNP